nr:unnamed protein product [Haemonchus contortus]
MCPLVSFQESNFKSNDVLLSILVVLEALENSFVQLLIDSDEEADNEYVSGAPDGLLADAVESSDDEDSEGESDAGWSSTIVQPSVVSCTEDSGIQNDDVYALL